MNQKENPRGLDYSSTLGRIREALGNNPSLFVAPEIVDDKPKDALFSKDTLTVSHFNIAPVSPVLDPKKLDEIMMETLAGITPAVHLTDGLNWPNTFYFPNVSYLETIAWVKLGGLTETEVVDSETATRLGLDLTPKPFTAEPIRKMGEIRVHTYPFPNLARFFSVYRQSVVDGFPKDLHAEVLKTSVPKEQFELLMNKPQEFALQYFK